MFDQNKKEGSVMPKQVRNILIATVVVAGGFAWASYELLKQISDTDEHIEN